MESSDGRKLMRKYSGKQPLRRARQSVVAVLFLSALFLYCASQPSIAADEPHPNALTPERIAALPAAQQTAWREYVARSQALQRADKSTLEAEVKAAGLAKPVAAPIGPVFKTPASTAAGWFGGAEARQSADVLVSFQMPSGGWSKAVDYSKGARRAGMHWSTHADGWYYAGTFDNRTTTEQLIFLAKTYQATQEPKYSAAFLKGLDYIFAAQLPNGGWPQVYPLAGDYHDEVTYNDDAMIHVLQVLQGVASGQPEYSFVDEARRNKARAAVDAGVRCILQSQVFQDGKPTVWCAQHDPLTLAPAAARKFEPASLSGGESLGIVRFLMGIEQPSGEIKAAVEGAVAWFEAVKITGIEIVNQTNAEGGTVMAAVANPKAPPQWARFCELGTNRPIFIGRDTVIHYNIAELDQERGKGYAWYVTKPIDLLTKEYPKWKARVLTSAALAPQAMTKIKIVLVGDSTVASNSGWGDAFAKLVGPIAQVVNLAAGGRSSKSYINEGRWKSALEQKPDYVLIQFGHNDQPGKGVERETDPATTYPQYMARYVDEARAIGAKPILVTSLTRRNFKDGKISDNLAPYVEAVRKLAAQKNVPLVDLYARSIEQLNVIGPQAAAAYDAPVTEPAKPDRTHLSAVGAQATAQLVAEELRKVAPYLASYLIAQSPSTPAPAGGKE
jgi:PelA/Pel-15E family pectate lyase